MKYVMATVCLFVMVCTSCKTMKESSVNSRAKIMKPEITGEWKHIYNPNDNHKNPGKGKWYTNDHCFVQDNDGKWHAYGIVGYLPARPWDVEKQLFHITADSFTGEWKEHDFIKADARFENHLWAPHVLKDNGTLYMTVTGGNRQKTARNYASFGTVNLKTSKDGFKWTQEECNPIVSDPGHARDSFILKDGKDYYLYYTRTVSEIDLRSAVAVKHSTDLKHWTAPKLVHIQPLRCNWGGDCESPFVIKKDGIYYMFICLAMTGYNKTQVFWSKDPNNFPKENLVTELKTHASEIIQDKDGNWFISDTGWDKKGLYIAPMKWVEK